MTIIAPQMVNPKIVIFKYVYSKSVARRCLALRRGRAATIIFCALNVISIYFSNVISTYYSYNYLILVIKIMNDEIISKCCVSVCACVGVCLCSMYVWGCVVLCAQFRYNLTN